MRYMVMEVYPTIVILLDEDGRWYKAANRDYEVGQSVYDPILMPEDTVIDRTDRSTWIVPLRRVTAALGAIAAVLVFFVVFQIATFSTVLSSSIYMSVNPRVVLQLNENGAVIDAHALNPDGEELLDGYRAKRKDKNRVIRDLARRANDMGLLSQGDTLTLDIDADEKTFAEYGLELRDEIAPVLEPMGAELRIVDHNAPAPEPVIVAPPTPAPVETTPPVPEPEPEPTPTPAPAPVVPAPAPAPPAPSRPTPPPVVDDDDDDDDDWDDDDDDDDWDDSDDDDDDD